MKGLAAVWSLGCAVMTSSYGLHAQCRSLLRCLSKPGSSPPLHSASRHSSAQSDEGKSKVRPLDRAIAIRNKSIVFMRKHFWVEYCYPLGFILILGIRYLYLYKATLLSVISSSFVIHVLPSSLLLLTLVTSSRVKVLFGWPSFAILSTLIYCAWASRIDNDQFTLLSRPRWLDL